MRNRWIMALLLLALLAGALGLGLATPVQASGLRQAPTISIPTVTSSPQGPYIIVNPGQDPPVNVRDYPSTVNTQKIGILLGGQKAPALGKFEDWILIIYPGVPGGQGWVYSGNVQIGGGELPLVEPPPTPTPAVTATIDPTLAAQFVVTIAPTRLPTFTQPAPLIVPTLPVESGGGVASRVPIGLVIVGLGSLGILLGLVSLARGR